ncbi:PSP1 C-terminal conserved region-domain-containing protein [Circinella umbellata]|nr:PSP1 C-terminal conserved region-domain-containing protein [Circinella umbellata]
MELSLPPPFILDTTAFTINKQSQQSSPLPSPSIPLSPQSIIGSNNSTSYIPPSNLQKVPEEQLTATKDSSALSPMIDSVSTIENTETKNTNNDSNDKKEDNQNLVSSNSNTTKNPILSSSTKQVSSTTTKTTKTMTTADIVAAAISKPKQKSTSTEKNKENILYMIEFKAGRTDFFYISDNNNMIRPKIGDLVIVEADRGKDLGKVAMNNLSIEQVTLLQSQKSSSNNNNNDKNTNNSNNQSDTPLSSSSLSSSDIITTTTTTSGILSSSSSASTELISNDTLANTNNNSQHIKQIYRLAQSDEVNQLLLKNQDEQSALSVCQQKIKQRKLRMDVVDAEYQWDRRKLTFYFIAERRIDFRELVRELFKVYKTRIWM